MRGSAVQHIFLSKTSSFGLFESYNLVLFASMHDNVQTACLLNRFAFLKVLFDKIKPTEFEPLCSLLTPSNQRSTGQPSRVLHGHQ